jgi:signal transduction histidine kinase
LRRDGSTFAAQTNITSVRDRMGRLRYRIMSSIDISARQQAGAARDVADEQFRQVQKLEAIGQLTGGVAHDFNNLLGIIIANLDLLLSQEVASAMTRELAQESLDAALMGADLTQRLLAFARRQPLRPMQIDPNALVTDAAQLLRRTLEADIELVLDLATDAWPIVADPTQLHAALINLAGNARDAMPNGGRLRLATANRWLDSGADPALADLPAGQYVMIEVSDNGTGVSPEHIDHIFEPFFTTKETGKGTGLGLSMVFGFMKQSGGHVTVRSQPNMGAIFQLLLPHATAPKAVASEAAADSQLARACRTILVVEDNHSLRRTVLRKLHQLGYRTLEAEGSAAALRLIEQEKVDLVFTDIVMPGELDGIELARRVQAQWPAIKVVMTSGYSAAELGDRIAASGIPAQVLRKPYRGEELSRLLQEMLSG